MLFYIPGALEYGDPLIMGRAPHGEVAKAAGAPEPLAIACDLMSFKSVRAAGEKLNAELQEGPQIPSKPMGEL